MILVFIILIIVIYLVINLDEIKKEIKRIREKRENKNSDAILPQFSSENLSDKDKFREAFTINSKPFHDIPDDMKKKVIFECICIEGLSEEDRIFIAKMLWDIIIEGNSPLIIKVRNFIFNRFNLRYKYLAERVVRHIINEIYYQFYRLEQLQELDEDED